MKKYLFFLFLLIAFLACTPTADKNPAYFDLKGYFNDQIALLDSLKPEVNKSVDSDSIQETKKLSDIQWKDELQPFLECDLNKPAWKGKFFIDTLEGEDNGSYALVYSAKDSTFQMQNVLIDFNSKGNIDHVRMKSFTKNKLYSSMQTLNYSPHQSYSMETEQDVFLSGKKTTGIFATFLSRSTRK